MADQFDEDLERLEKLFSIVLKGKQIFFGQDEIKKADEITRDVSVNTKTNKVIQKGNSEEELLIVAVDELRRHYDHVCEGFNHLRTKALAMLGGEVAIISFLFSAPGPHKFIPTLIYGLVFLAVGILLMSLSFLLFLWVMAPTSWSHPPETKLTQSLNKNFNSSPVRFLEYLNDEYNTIIQRCIGKVSLKATRFTWGVYCLSVGTFIMVMLKYGGGTIHI